MLPLQIRITEHEARLTAAAVPYGISVVSDLEFAFVVPINGEMVVMTPYEFACRDASCRPPGKNGGTGGSKKAGAAGGGGGIGTSEQHPIHPMTTRYATARGAVGGGADHERDMARFSGETGTVRADGILEEPWLDKNSQVVLTPKQEKAFAGALEKMGTSEETWTDNLVGVAKRAAEGDITAAQEAKVWYQTEHDKWGVPMAKDLGVSVEQLMAVATVTSTNSQWDGKEGSNKQIAEKIIRMVKDDKEFVITPEAAEAYNSFSSDKQGSGGSWGARTIEPGTYKASQLETGTLARVAGTGYGIGGGYFTQGLVKAFALARGEVTPNQAMPSLKQRSFFNNLVNPGIDYSSTNDFWMTRAAFGNSQLTFNSKAVTGVMNIKQYEAVTQQQANSLIGSEGTGNSSMFAGMTRATKTAMGRLRESDPRFKDIRTNEFQALVWVQMQKEYKNLPGGTP